MVCVRIVRDIRAFLSEVKLLMLSRFYFRMRCRTISYAALVLFLMHCRGDVFELHNLGDDWLCGCSCYKSIANNI